MNTEHFQNKRSSIKRFYWTILPLVYCIALFLSNGGGVVFAYNLPIPNSDISYPGASTSIPFTAKAPYLLNFGGASTTLTDVSKYLSGFSPTYDFSGTTPFVNSSNNRNPVALQAWDDLQNIVAEIYTSSITNDGIPGSIIKYALNGTPTTLIRYVAGDGITEGKCRSKLMSYPVPTRVHVRWELNVQFGNADGINDWFLTPSTQWGNDGNISNGGSPVLFWAMTNESQSNGPFSFNVDTDNLDSTKLMIEIWYRVGTATSATEMAVVHGISPNTMVPIVIEGFLDERSAANGGKGIMYFWVNNALVLVQNGPNTALNSNPSALGQMNYWSINAYLWNEAYPYAHTRSVFFQTARMFVYPTTIQTSDATPPTAPQNLVATSPNSPAVNLSWGASTDNLGVAGYIIWRNGVNIANSAVNSFTDTTAVAGQTYNYVVQAYDTSENISASSNTATVNTTAVKISSVAISSVKTGGVITATFKWSTNISSTGIVYYGTSPNNLILSVVEDT